MNTPSPNRDLCLNDCAEPLRFPRKLHNRPGLSHIDYRIGTYSDIRAALLRHLDRDEVLQGWTHREADDPGIALLEGAAILGDILTFYQQHYANEAFLRTARWRESVGDLVRLLGYRLSPGLGGRATFAVGVKADAQANRPVTIPAGFGLKAQVEGLEKAAEFQTVSAAIAYPHLSQFSLYRPRRPQQTIKAGSHRLEIAAVGGKRDIQSLQASDLKPGDRLILISNRAEILVVSRVEQSLDRIVVELKGALTFDRAAVVTAYRLGRSFRHFGHNAPPKLTRLQADGETTIAVQENTRFLRKRCVRDSDASVFYSTLDPREIPLDQSVDDLAAGNALIVQNVFGAGRSAVALPIEQVVANSITWGNVSGASTTVILASDAVCGAAEALGTAASVTFDIRKVQYHETTSAALTLQAPTTWEDGPLPSDAQLSYWGTYAEALTLLNRSLILKRADGETLTVKVLNSPFSLSQKDKINLWRWPLSFDQTLPFTFQDFDELTPTVTVYGNLIEANQGKAEKEAVLGNGDSRATFQTFKLPKAPLTYFNSSRETPPEVPELDIYVNDRRWSRSPSLFNQGPKAEVYIVREDLNGESWVQFGDGKTGARLPSGVKNVKAKYRTGNGAYGALQPETKVQATSRLTRLDTVWLPGLASGGAAPETGENARVAAPGKVQSLGRLVSLQDFETATLAIAGVSKVSAAWQQVDNVPAVVITVLMEAGREPEVAEVQRILNRDNRCRGPQRFPILVVLGQRRYSYLRVVVSADSAYREETLMKAIRAALGIADEASFSFESVQKGIFHLSQRQFGQREYATRIEASIQNVEGILWVQVEALGRFQRNLDPAEQSFPAIARFQSVLPCGPPEVLALHPQHFQCQFVTAPSASRQEDC